MANKPTNGGDDSENSVFEIELPKKPPPQIIDLADDEIIINVRAEIPDTPISPNVPWVSQYDLPEFRSYILQSALRRRQETPVNPNGPWVNQYDVTGFGPHFQEFDRKKKEEKKGVDAFVVDREPKIDEKSQDSSGDNEEMSDEKMKMKGEGVIKLKNERGTKDKRKKGKQTDGDREHNKDKDKKKKRKKRDKKREKRKRKKDKKKIESHVRHESNGERNNSQTEGNESIQNNQSRSDYQLLVGSPAVRSVNSILLALKEATQSKKSGSDNQAQQGSSGSDRPRSFSQDSHPHTQASDSESWRTHGPYPEFPRPNWLPGQEAYPLPEPVTNYRKKRDLKAHHPEHWTPEMVKFYDEDWGNENEFDLEKLQAEMDKNPSLWEISDKDIDFWKDKDVKFKVKCFNCLSYGHESYECKEEKRTAKCHMCGLPGHIAYNCPQAICLNCATTTTGYVTKCKNCKFGLDKTCERCLLTGHIFSECTDHWRLYHSTVGTIRVKEPEDEILKPEAHRWCCNCGRKGHLHVDCGFCAKNSEFSDTKPFVTSYTKAFTRSSQLSYGYEDPANHERLKIKMEDNIMTNPSQKHAYQTKISQLKNHMKAFRKQMLSRGVTPSSRRNRHFGEGIDARNINILRLFPLF